MMRLPLSYMYVPGDRSERFGRAVDSGADAVVLDLEDAVPLKNKASARADVAQWLRSRPENSENVWVRINSDEHMAEDLEAVVAAGVGGIWLPKCEDLATLIELDGRLRSLESADREPVQVSPLVETGAALWNIREIAGGPRVAFIQLGEVDLAADMGITPGPDDSELLWARSRAVAASSAAGIRPPLGPASPEIRDTAAFEVQTRALSRMGFIGRACIHPKQIPTVHEVFSPSDEEVEQALEVLETMARAGGAAAVDSAGRLIDEAVARGARRTLARLRRSIPGHPMPGPAAPGEILTDRAT